MNSLKSANSPCALCGGGAICENWRLLSTIFKIDLELRMGDETLLILRPTAAAVAKQYE